MITWYVHHLPWLFPSGWTEGGRGAERGRVWCEVFLCNNKNLSHYTVYFKDTVIVFNDAFKKNKKPQHFISIYWQLCAATWWPVTYKRDLSQTRLSAARDVHCWKASTLGDLLGLPDHVMRVVFLRIDKIIIVTSSNATDKRYLVWLFGTRETNTQCPRPWIISV